MCIRDSYNIDQTAWYEGQETWEPNTKRYASLITHMDAAIGRLLNELEQLNLSLIHIYIRWRYIDSADIKTEKLKIEVY